MTAFTRRALGRLATASIGSACRAQTPFRLNIGVGTFSYHLLSLDDMIVQLKANRIREIEMSRGEFMLMKPPTQEMVETARRKFDAAGIGCVSYYTATIKNQQDLDYAIRYAKSSARVTSQATQLAPFCMRSTANSRSPA